MLKETGLLDKGLQTMLTRLLIVACLSAGCFVSFGPSAWGADDFPSKATYLFFIQGAPAGKSDIAFAGENGAYVFTSTTEVALGEQRHSLSCRSEFDKNTLRPRLFRYEGTRGGESVSGSIRLDPDSIRASLEVSGTQTSSRMLWVDGTFVFQNYVPEHLAVLARYLAASPKAFERFSILFPSDMMAAPGIATIETEVELATRSAPIVCKIYSVTLQNSAPFYLFVDSKRNSLVYMDFPVTQTEVFLESAFGSHPGTQYSAPRKPGSEG